jgi:hypothetical protein
MKSSSSSLQQQQQQFSSWTTNTIPSCKESRISHAAVTITNNNNTELLMILGGFVGYSTTTHCEVYNPTTNNNTILILGRPFDRNYRKLELDVRLCVKLIIMIIQSSMRLVDTVVIPWKY